MKAKQDEAKKAEAKARLEAEKKINEVKAKALAEKKAAEEAAKAAAEAPAEEATEAPAEEAPAAEAAAEIKSRAILSKKGNKKHKILIGYAGEVFFIIIFAATIYLLNEQSNEKINLPARCRCRIRSL